MNIQLTQQGNARFNDWLIHVGKPALNHDAVIFEALNNVEDDLFHGYTTSYELGQRYTQTGQPEIFRFIDTDYVITSN